MCVYWNQCVREHISKGRRLARERDFRGSLLRQLSEPAFCFFARGPTSASPLLLTSWTTFSSFASYLPCLPVLDRPATPANSCRHPVLSAPREKSTRDRYLRGKMARRLSLLCDFWSLSPLEFWFIFLAFRIFSKWCFIESFNLIAFMLNCDYLCRRIL